MTPDQDFPSGYQYTQGLIDGLRAKQEELYELDGKHESPESQQLQALEGAVNSEGYGRKADPETERLVKKILKKINK